MLFVIPASFEVVDMAIKFQFESFARKFFFFLAWVARQQCAGFSNNLLLPAGHTTPQPEDFWK